MKAHASLCESDAVPLPGRQPGFLVNGGFPVRGRVLWRGSVACGSGLVLIGHRWNRPGVGVGPVLQGARLGQRKGWRTKLPKSAPKGRVFVAFRPPLSMANPARGAGWRYGGTRRLCVRVRFHRDGGGGDLNSGGGRKPGLRY